MLLRLDGSVRERRKEAVLSSHNLLDTHEAKYEYYTKIC
jgi:hypothetical protein